MPVRARSRSSISGDDLLAGTADRLQLVELRVDAVARESAVARERRRLVDKRSLDGVADVGQIVELGHERTHERRLEGRRGSVRTRGMTASDVFRPTRSRGPAVPSAARATSRSRSCTAFTVSRNLPRSVVEVRQLFDRVEPVADGLERHQRPKQPRSQQAAAHRRDRAIEFVEQRPFTAAL